MSRRKPFSSNRESAGGEPVIVSISSLQGEDNPSFLHNDGSVVGNNSTNNNNNNNTNGRDGEPSISVISGPDATNGISSNASSLQHRGALPDGHPSLFEKHPTGNGLQVNTFQGFSGPGKTPGSGQPPTPAVTQASNTVEMKKSINLLHCTAIMVAVTGHSSIFVSPTSILGETGSVGGALIVWLIGGLINLGMALCFAELGTMYPKAGGPYSYAMKSFGPLTGFLIMWGYTVLIAGPFWAFLAYTAALYIVRPVFPDCTTGDIKTAINLLAGWIMVLMVVLNCVYMKYVTKVQTLLSSSKIIVLLIIIVAGIYNLCIGKTENFENMFEDTTQEPGKFAVAIFYSVFSYGGWQVMTTLLEEVKDPARDPPRSVHISFAIVITKYIMTNVAYFTLLSPKEILGSSAVASLFIERLYSPLTIVVSVFVALTSIGALNASIMGHSRLLFAGARNGHMPQILGMVSTKYLTPWPSIIVYMIWALVMLFNGGVTDMMDFISLFSTIMGIVVIASLLYLRWKKPNENRPYKVTTIIAILEMIVNIAVLILGIYQKPQKMGIGLAILFAGIPIYWFGVLWKNKPREFTSIVDGLTIFAQKLFLVSKVKN